ncbi:hypothetical protein CHLNCDRAFT_55564 [Chlorella variabilis]|uniref:Uncharacterized protein n=1 Tax=Chlorella variabilis TaxID=554065 RepID=E1ZTQ0_CHLVA|nr:hypothetical protein CHLNCDRAFT_55564 [Chlorella variabilis]EFN50798.1 hypothetical protein CHLNCDRAFT_55564 [Chlorella variabilis]|eukprot:XP_005842900.1 hypothetical protein CHLNCDRAFT_55564 [Chlorella variabilis]
MASQHTPPRQAAPPPQPPPPAAATAAASGQPAPGQPGQAGSYQEEVQEGFRQLRALFAAIDAGQLSPDDPGAFESVRGRPGVVLDPMPWQRLVSLVAQGVERALGSLGRHPLGIKRYWDHRDHVILRDHVSVTDYLMLDIFGFAAELEPDGRRRALVPPGFFLASTPAGGSSGGCSSGNGGGGEGGGFQLVTKWRDNDFPYHLQPGVAHLNLWANRPLTAEEVQEHIAARVPPAAPRCWFVNTPSLQSVPALWHAHVLVLEEGEGRRPGGSGGLAAPPAVQRDSTAQQEHTSAPPQQRQFELGTAEQLAAAVALLAGTQRQLDALAAAAESAASPAALEQLAAAFAELMVETLDGAGMRQRSSNGGAQRPHCLPRSLQRQYGIRDARRAQRNAVQQAAVAQQRGIGPEQQDAALRRELDLQQPAPVDLGELGEAAQRRQLAQLQEALAKGGASRLEHYVHNVVGALNLAPAMFGQRETYLDAVRRRQDREALAQLRTGSHWGAEETGRWTRRPREQRVCPHCHDGIEDAPHMLLTCPLYAPLRLNFPDLFAEPHSPHRFLRQKPCRLAAFAVKRLAVDLAQHSVQNCMNLLAARKNAGGAPTTAR